MNTNTAKRELEIEVNNGGFYQYFWNFAGDAYYFAVDALEDKNQELLIRAKEMLFGDEQVPTDTFERRDIIDSIDESVFDSLLEIDRRWYEIQDKAAA